MAHNVDIGGVTYVSASKAGSKVGYSSDYVARLAREKKIAAQQIGRQWFVDPISLENFYSDANRRKKIQKEKLRQERVAERNEMTRVVETIKSSALQFSSTPTVVEAMKNASAFGALMKSTGVMVAGVLVGFIFYGSAMGTVVSPLSQAAIVLDRAEVSLSQSALSLEGFFGALRAFFGLGESDDVEEYNDDAAAVDDRVTAAPDSVETHKAKPGSEEGVVVFEEGTYTDEELESLKRSFSDEVHIARDSDDPNTGIITPVFKNRSDEQYRFLLVPVAEGSGP